MRMAHTGMMMRSEARIASMDQCRGLCIIAMIGGNFAGKFAFMPWLLTHHPYGLSIAELFGPVFFVMVGMGYRWSFARRAETLGLDAARRAALRRYVLIGLLGFIVYFGHFWDALTHIGMAGLLLLPVIDKPTRVLAATGLLFLVLFQGIFLHTEYGSWVMSRGHSLNGGPLAALSWGALAAWGAVIQDWRIAYTPRAFTLRLLAVSLSLCAAGWLLSLPWPGLKEAWPFTRYGMTAPYPLAAGGFAALLYLCFYWHGDRWGKRLPLATPMGANPLLMYAIMGLFIGGSKLAIRVWGEPGFYTALGSYIVICLICYSAASALHRRNIILRIS